MSNKNSKTDLVLNSAENLADEILFNTANTFLEDAVKSIPFASLISSSIQAYTHYRTLKEQKQRLAFIQEIETNNQNFIKHFFQDKNNAELGLEILGILDQTYLEHQARMIGRTVLLKYHGKISKQEFDKYTYIITRLNNHLIHLIKELSLIETNKDDPDFEYDIQNPNVDLASFSFLVQVPSQLYPGGIQIAQFKRTETFYYFYENIFND
ncbi:hypothetical protein [Acinetobacter sp. YH12219]|uniref:hypothetical protein n=1 Tax=Acinetobacter sp. YH12219 TaxID=2601153 RepID=UPI0015D24469|nr:hypothetical protein [Acinetobacter sp. YH12219]